MKYLVTGGCGFLGSNLAAEILQQGNELIIFDNLSRFGTTLNLDWLRTKGSFSFIHGDIRCVNDVENLLKANKPDVIFHLAGQTAMTTSICRPKLDFEVNALGTIHLLEAVRKNCPEAIIIYSSTNKVYGDLEWVNYKENDSRYAAVDFPYGFDEKTPLDFHSPYGCSKGTADQYMLDYARIYGMKTIVFRHSSMFGGRQFATYDQGWIGWFVSQALKVLKDPHTEPFTISGNGKQVRDVLFASDVVNCYLTASQNIDKCTGQIFNIGGGIENSISILELLKFLEKEVKVSLRYREIPWRESDQKVFIADIRKAKGVFGWQPKIGLSESLLKMIEWNTHAKI